MDLNKLKWTLLTFNSSYQDLIVKKIMKFIKKPAVLLYLSWGARAPEILVTDLLGKISFWNIRSCLQKTTKRIGGKEIESVRHVKSEKQNSAVI